MKYFSDSTLIIYVVISFTNGNSLKGHLMVLGTWIHGRKTCSKMIHKLIVIYKQGTTVDRLRFYDREEGESLGQLEETTRAEYLFLRVSTFLICKIIFIG